MAGVTLLGALLTYFTYTSAGPWVCNNLPLMDRYMPLAPFIQGPLIAAAGVAHFYPLHEEFCSFYPHRGAWGFWYASSFKGILSCIALKENKSYAQCSASLPFHQVSTPVPSRHTVQHRTVECTKLSTSTEPPACLHVSGHLST